MYTLISQPAILQQVNIVVIILAFHLYTNVFVHLDISVHILKLNKYRIDKNKQS